MKRLKTNIYQMTSLIETHALLTGGRTTESRNEDLGSFPLGFLISTSLLLLVLSQTEGVLSFAGTRTANKVIINYINS